jgi:tetratricopeptide (TPR) repeat protein
MATRTRALDPDTLAALEEQRDFLLRSLDDLEREHEAGDVDDHDYQALKDDYTARAARVIRSVEAHEAQMAAARRPRSRARVALVGVGVAAFALVAGILVAQAAGRRDAGDTITGNVRETTRDQLDQAVQMAAQGDYEGAIEVEDQVLADQPDNVEALTYKGWFQWRSGDQSGVVTLIDATEADPDYPATHVFLAVAFRDLGRTDTALRELDRLDELDPPPEIARMADGLRSELESASSSSSSSSSSGG